MCAYEDRILLLGLGVGENNTLDKQKVLGSGQQHQNMLGKPVPALNPSRCSLSYIFLFNSLNKLTKLAVFVASLSIRASLKQVMGTPGSDSESCDISQESKACDLVTKTNSLKIIEMFPLQKLPSDSGHSVTSDSNNGRRQIISQSELGCGDGKIISNQNETIFKEVASKRTERSVSPDLIFLRPGVLFIPCSYNMSQGRVK